MPTGHRTVLPVTEPSPVLLITHESVGPKMAGPGVRSWELARALGEQGARVTLASPFASDRHADNVTFAQFSWQDPQSLETLIKSARAIMGIGPVISRVVNCLGHGIEVPTIVDLYDISEIERILLNLTLWHYDFEPTPVFIHELHTYLRQGDFFICASEKQYDFWLGALMATGRINSQTLGMNFNVDELIEIVPLGLPGERPVPGDRQLKGIVPGIGVNDKVLFWGGGIWDWTDPLTLLNAFKIVCHQRDDVRVVFAGLHHFDKSTVPSMSIAARLTDMVEREGWLGKYVFFQDWIPYDHRSSYLLEADIGISLNIHSVENRYAARARLLDYLWAGLPCVLSRGDDFSNLLHETGLAILVTPGDIGQVADAILRILGDRNLRERSHAQIVPWVKQLTWSNCIRPLVNFLQHPHKAPDAAEAGRQLRDLLPLRQEWEQLVTENRFLKEREHSLEHELERFRQRRAVRYAETASRLVAKIKPRR